MVLQPPKTAEKLAFSSFNNNFTVEIRKPQHVSLPNFAKMTERVDHVNTNHFEKVLMAFRGWPPFSGIPRIWKIPLRTLQGGLRHASRFPMSSAARLKSYNLTVTQITV